MMAFFSSRDTFSSLKNDHILISGSVIFCICFLSMLFQRVEGDVGLVLRLVAVIAAILLFVMLFVNRLVKQEAVAVFVVLTLFVSCNIFLTHAKAPLALMQIYVMAIMGLYLVNRALDLWCARAIFWIVIISMICLYATSPNKENIFPEQGKNFCGAYALLAFFILAVSASSQRKKRTTELLVSALACLLVSIYATGRGSIISCSILVCLMALIKYRELRIRAHKEAFLACILGLLLVGIILALFTDVAAEVFSRFGSLGAERSNEARLDLYRSFALAATESPEVFILGFDPNTIDNRVIALTGGNLHCSLFQWQANFGFIGTVFLFVYSAMGMKRLWQSGNTIVLAACITIYFRALTDTMMVGALWDIVFFYLLFSVVLKKDDSIQKNNPIKEKIPTVQNRITRQERLQ